jgi:hypothetical protein
MFHLDYLSFCLTVLATILLARKSWIGLLIAIANSLIVCAIGLRTSQLGFIPANLFCICVYALSMRSWLKKKTHSNRDQAQQQDTGSGADDLRMCLAMRRRTVARTRRFPSDPGKSTAIKTTIEGLAYLHPTHRHGHFAAEGAMTRMRRITDEGTKSTQFSSTGDAPAGELRSCDDENDSSFTKRPGGAGKISYARQGPQCREGWRRLRRCSQVSRTRRADL